MKIKINIGICIMLLTFFSNAFSQDINNFNNYDPAASQSVGLGDLSSSAQGVDLYTGKLNYGIDLKKLNLAGIALPIGLHYITSGFKVQEMAGNTGLGWSTNFSMVITRAVRGLPDEYYYGYCGESRTGGNYYGAMTKDLLKKSAANEWDSEPDKFYFSFLGFSGSFVLDPDGHPVLQSNSSGIKIIKSPFERNVSAPYNTWIIADQAGNKFYFGDDAIDFTTNAHHHEKTLSNDGSKSSWYIKKIITASNKEINFTYWTGSFTTYTNYTTISRHVTNSNICTGNADATWAENTDVSILPVYLSKIKFQNTEVNFEYNHARQDLPNGKALTDIKITYANKLTDHFLLSYGYFVSDDGTATKRLKLNGISEDFLGVNTKTLFAFSYNEQTNLPARNSLQTDYWGYYNSNNTGSNLIGIADKGPDTIRTKANILTKVTNTLGGSTYFAYEQNTMVPFRPVDAGNNTIGGIRLKRTYSKSNDNDQMSYNSTDYSYNKFDAPTYSSGQSLIDRHVEPKLTVGYSCTGHSGSEIFSTSESLMDAFDDNGSPVGYSNVKISKSDGSSSRYKFTNIIDYPDQYEKATFYVNPPYGFPNNNLTTVTQHNEYPVTSYSFARGKILSEELMNNIGQIIKQTIFAYNLTNSINSIVGIKPYLVLYTQDDEESGFEYGKYQSFTQDLRLTGKTETSFRAGIAKQSIQQTFEYTDYAPNLLRSLTTQISGGKTDKQKFRYAFDVIPTIPTSPPGILFPLTSLVYNNNIINPVENIHSIIENSQEKIVSANVTQYYPFNSGVIFPSNEFRLQIKSPLLLANYAPYTVSYTGSGEINNLDSKMQPLSNYKAYDDYGNVSQVQPVDGVNVFNSILYGYDGLYKIADIANADQNQIAYTSFESDFTGNWVYQGKTEFNLNSATGKYCYNLNRGDILRYNLINTQTYILTYWTTNSTPYIVSGTQGNASLLAQHNGWYIFKHVISGVNTVDISGNGNIDEVRLIPTGAQMTTYTYEPLVGITSKTNENNQRIFSEYDEMNRLLFTKDNDKNITQANCYNNRGEQTNCFNFVKNGALSSPFYRNDCGPGYVGNMVTYNVEAGRYSASSLAAANALAQADINLNGQRYANTFGTCTQQTIYAKLVFDNYHNISSYQDQDNYSSQNTADLHIYLYSDTNGTPYTLTAPLTVTLQTDMQAEFDNTSTATYEIPANTSSYFVGNVTMDYSQTYTDPFLGYGHVTESAYYVYSLLSDPYYAILQTQY